MHRHKWSNLFRDIKNRRIKYRDLWIRQCLECKEKQIGIIASYR